MRGKYPVYEVLARGPMTAAALAVACGARSSGAISGVLSWASNAGRIVEIGTVEQARAAGIAVEVSPKTPPKAKIYALPGTAKLPPIALARLTGRGAGSGVIAGKKEIRGYLW